MIESKYRVNKAILLAAGLGERLQPLTHTTPKALIEVNGIKMIDSIFKALQHNNINDIYVVVGHLKEQFRDWAKDKEGVELIENPYYDSCNNISSLYMARDKLEDCMIMDADQVIYNPEILSPFFSRSGYNATWSEGFTKEWLMEVEDGVVKSCSRTGGAHGWQLHSVSRWTKEDGKRLKKHLEIEFEKGNKQIYWDDVVMFNHLDEYKLGIFKMQPSDMVEIDSLEELKAIDERYRAIYNGDDNKKKK